MIILQARLPKPVDMMFLWRPRPHIITSHGISDVRVRVRDGGSGGRIVVVFVIFAVEDDGPAGRKSRVVELEVIALEVETAEDGLDGEGLAVGEVDY